MKFLLSHKRLTTLLMCSWLLATGWGMWRLAAYSFEPGAMGPASGDWPADGSLARTPGKFTAVLALHPECPCSRATLDELDSITAEDPGHLDVQLLFVQHPGLPPVQESSLWRRAARIGGVHLTADVEGHEALRFGARTSGETRLYSPDGRLVFHGGITIARGHAGDNPGHTAIVAMLRQGNLPDSPIVTPVFGCAL